MEKDDPEYFLSQLRANDDANDVCFMNLISYSVYFIEILYPHPNLYCEKLKARSRREDESNAEVSSRHLLLLGRTQGRYCRALFKWESWFLENCTRFSRKSMFVFIVDLTILFLFS
jgi:hypothetical protein